MAIAVLGMIGTGVYKVKQWGAEEVRAEWNSANEKARAEEAARSAKAAKELEDERQKRKVVTRTVTKVVDKIVDRPVYRNVCLDDSGLRCLDSAIDGKIDPGCKPDGGMPAAGAPDGKGR
jgi:glutamyl-tRNA reductase